MMIKQPPGFLPPGKKYPKVSNGINKQKALQLIKKNPKKTLAPPQKNNI